VILRVEYHGFGSDSDGDAFEGSEGGVFEQTAPIQHRANELFCIEPKDNQVEAIQYLLCHRSDRIRIAETGFGKSIIFQAAPDLPGRVEVCELNHYALE